jgi:hypothetical protein
VNLAPLFTTAAAVSRLWHSPHGRIEEFERQIANTDRVAEVADSTGWQSIRPAASMRSGILLLESKLSETRSAQPDALRFAFRRWGLAVSAYVGGLVRTSFLPDSLSSAKLNKVRSALCRCA